MKLNKREIKLLIEAIGDGIRDREEFLYCHLEGRAKVPECHKAIVGKTKRLIANYRKMRSKLYAALKEARDAK
jgi:hypothetical protein